MKIFQPQSSFFFVLIIRFRFLLLSTVKISSLLSLLSATTKKKIIYFVSIFEIIFYFVVLSKLVIVLLKFGNLFCNKSTKLTLLKFILVSNHQIACFKTIFCSSVCRFICNYWFLQETLMCGKFSRQSCRQIVCFF